MLAFENAWHSVNDEKAMFFSGTEDLDYKENRSMAEQIEAL